MGIFYTGKGDRGRSDLGYRRRVKKTRPEVEAVGVLDELNSFLGLVKNQPFGGLTSRFRGIVHSIQENLFIIQAQVAALMFRGKFKPPILRMEKVREVEKMIDGFEKAVKPARKFIIYGASQGAAWLDYARAIARRAERTALKLEGKLAPETMAYLNRLSSLLYAMARLAVKKAGKKEKHPTYG